ncbi:NAD(P)H-dependent oxidoreductase [Myroides indicus]|uniref:Putative NADPH-quinone reductase n=1 Tax=Myroides indicus TaxID=1323422 RepID=A0A4R7EUL1_9FLAO|nr:NAD(P)H-dependent oxidoreductase [Myroides indicus]TDS57223.1 putative NADPH-quinone reductase [Myroides indicus]
MLNIFIINGGQIFGTSSGQLNKKLAEITDNFMSINGFNVRASDINYEYDELVELENFLWADITIWHVPIWWFQLPHRLKEYMDVVFKNGEGRLYESDGRTRNDPQLNYGRGGLLHSKKYLITTSWNAPKGAFTIKGEIMDQTSVDDGVLFGFHRAMEFLGLSRLKGFHFYDVLKNMDKERFEEYENQYIEHLNRTLKKEILLVSNPIDGKNT